MARAEFAYANVKTAHYIETVLFRSSKSELYRSSTIYHKKDTEKYTEQQQ